ncbi:hypothetical protein F5879DRAFT_995530 [Lentinula edodes]|nr:hypothetical protein F5879DRAFT_995530 [Lentinula edodes]
MSGSRTQTTTTTTTADPSRSRPAAPPPPAGPIGQENEDLGDDEDEILRRAHKRVGRIREQKAAAAAKKKAKEEAAKKVAEEARRKKAAAAREVEERRRLLAEAATTRSQRGTSPSEMSISPRRPVVELWWAAKSKGKGKGPSAAEILMTGMTMKTTKTEHLANGAKTRSSLAKCRQARGVQSSREGGSGKCIAIMESQMAQSLANLWALWEADSKTHQYLCQLLRRQEDDHARLIAMEMRMAMMGMGEGLATAEPSRRTTERQRPLK